MKMLSVIVFLACSILNSRSDDWVIHGALGTNPWIGFTRISYDQKSIDRLTLSYGATTDWLDLFDGWTKTDISYIFSIYTNGEVAVIPEMEGWNTSEIFPGTWGSCSSISWFIEDGPPDYLGGDSIDGPTVPGEYWVDWSDHGTIRIETSKPSDFGKWLGDGSVNPHYVEPLAPWKPNRGKHLGKLQAK